MKRLIYAETESENGELRWEVHASDDCPDATVAEDWTPTIQPLAQLLCERIEEDARVMRASTLRVCRCAVRDGEGRA